MNLLSITFSYSYFTLFLFIFLTFLIFFVIIQYENLKFIVTIVKLILFYKRKYMFIFLFAVDNDFSIANLIQNKYILLGGLVLLFIFAKTKKSTRKKIAKKVSRILA